MVKCQLDFFKCLRLHIALEEFSTLREVKIATRFILDNKGNGEPAALHLDLFVVDVKREDLNCGRTDAL